MARRNDEVIYVQATYLMVDETTRQREFGNLETIRDNYPKYVVSLDEWTSGSCPVDIVFIKPHVTRLPKW